VRYWGLGNELWGEFQVGHLSVERYVEKAKQWALALRRVDPTIQLVACGHNRWSDWDRMVIDELVPYVDFHSVHIYTGSDDYWSNVLLPHQVDRALRASRAMIDRARYVADVRHPVHVVYDEWNVWFPTREDRRRDKIVAERHTLSDALAVATYLHIFVRHCDTLRMANLAQLVNVLAPIVTDDTRILLQAIYHPLRLAATYTLEFALDVAVDCDRIEHADTPDANRMTHRIADLGPFDVLDVAATSDASRSRVVLNVVNRRPDAPVEATIDLRGAQVRGEMTARVITADSPLTTNSFDHPEAVSVSERKVNVTGSCIPYEFPACSVTQLAFEVGE
jgi:alpha-N-arabinofuranosidase